MHMGADALKICFEEYVSSVKDLSAPCELVKAKQNVGALLLDLGFDVPANSIVWQLFSVPHTENIRISISIANTSITVIDSKATSLGMSRSRFFSTAAMAYNG